MRTFVGKKSRMILYTQREIILFTDGSFGYKRNKSEKFKQIIQPENIHKIARQKNYMTLQTNYSNQNDSDNTCLFKFSSEAEALNWFNKINESIKNAHKSKN